MFKYWYLHSGELNLSIFLCSFLPERSEEWASETRGEEDPSCYWVSPCCWPLVLGTEIDCWSQFFLRYRHEKLVPFLYKLYLIVYYICFLVCDTDIAHVYNKFIGPLPLTAEEFVSSLSKYFPHIIDTKMLLNTHPVLQQRMKKSKTSLSSAFTLLCPHISLSFAALDSNVKVEVEVDDLRFVLAFFCLYCELFSA